MIWLSCLKERSTLWFPEKMSMKIGWGWRGNITTISFTVRIKKLYRTLYHSNGFSVSQADLIFYHLLDCRQRPLFSFEDFFCVSPESSLYPSSNGINLLWLRGGESKNGSNNWKGVIERPTRKTWVLKENQFWLLLTTQFQVFWWISDALQQN